MVSFRKVNMKLFNSTAGVGGLLSFPGTLRIRCAAGSCRAKPSADPEDLGPVRLMRAAKLHARAYRG